MKMITLCFPPETKIPATESHVVQLAASLLRLGVIGNHTITFLHFLHDNDCRTLHSHDYAECFCDCWAVVRGKPYAFSEWVEQTGAVQ